MGMTLWLKFPMWVNLGITKKSTFVDGATEQLGVAYNGSWSSTQVSHPLFSDLLENKRQVLQFGPIVVLLRLASRVGSCFSGITCFETILRKDCILQG